ncbi:MAG: GldG family protein [Elusimicrobia bacterium]|nr:GldG family protein [Elusimicrobiota bacterium]
MGSVAGVEKPLTSPGTTRRRGWAAPLAVGAGVVVMAALNFWGDRFFARWDLTSDRRYSLSPSTRELLASLPDTVRVRFYLTPGLPQPYETHGRFVRDLLAEYQRAARGRWTVEQIAPDGSDDMDREFRRLHMAPDRFTQVASDQYQVREGHMGIVLRYNDKEEVLPFVKSVDTLEYELSSRVRSLIQPDKKNLFFISNHNEVSPNHIKEGPAGRLFEEFHVEPTRLSKEDPGLRPDAIFLLGPQTALSEEELDVLDHYISSGIPTVVALNRRVVFPQNFRSMAQETGLESFLEHYGVRVDRDFVMDPQCSNIAIRSANGSFLVKYFPFVWSDNLDRSHRTLSHIDVLGFPFASPLQPTIAPSSSLRWTVLARSSPESWIWPGLYNVDPPSLQKQWESDPPTGFAAAGREKDTGPFALAVMVEGSTVSFRSPRRQAPNIKLVVMGTSFFANPQVPNPDGNALFILSLAQTLTRGKHDLAIPPKSSPYRPLKPLSAPLRFLVKMAGYFGVPGIVILAGLAHWLNRRTQRDRIRHQFRPIKTSEM